MSAHVWVSGGLPHAGGKFILPAFASASIFSAIHLAIVDEPWPYPPGRTR